MCPNRTGQSRFTALLSLQQVRLAGAQVQAVFSSRVTAPVDSTAPFPTGQVCRYVCLNRMSHSRFTALPHPLKVRFADAQVYAVCPNRMGQYRITAPPRPQQVRLAGAQVHAVCFSRTRHFRLTALPRFQQVRFVGTHVRAVCPNRIIPGSQQRLVPNRSLLQVRRCTLCAPTG